MTGKFDLTNVNNMAFYISGPKLLFETTEISTHPNSTQQESNYIYLYTTKFGTSIKIRLNRKFESTEFETMRVNCINKPGKWTIRYMCVRGYSFGLFLRLFYWFWYSSDSVIFFVFLFLERDVIFYLFCRGPSWSSYI